MKIDMNKALQESVLELATLREAALELVRQAELSLDYRPEFRRAIANVIRDVAPRFEMTYCSQCGKALGAGDEGVSHCSNHRTTTGEVK
jgi:hypothetical protein